MDAQDLHIVAPLPQRGELQVQHVQAVVQVLPEAALHGLLQQVLVGGGDDAHVHRDHPAAAHPADLLLLQDPQQLHLGLPGDLADLVQKQGAAVGQFEHALPAAPGGAGEGPGLIAEQLALQQAVADGGAVDGHERAVPAVAGVVDGLGEQLLAGAGLSQDQHGGPGGGIALGDLNGAADGRGVPQNVVEGVFGHQALFMQFEADLLLAVLQLLHVLEGGHHAPALAVHQNGDPVGVAQGLVDLHDLVQLLFTALQHLRQKGVGQDRLHRLSHGICGPAAHDPLRRRIEDLDPAVFVDGQDGVMGEVQHRLVHLHLGLEALLLLGLLQLDPAQLDGVFQGGEDGPLRIFEDHVGQAQPLGPGVRPGAAHAEHGPVPQGVFDTGPAVGKVFENVIFCLDAQHLAHLQDVLPQRVVGEKCHQAGRIDPPLLQHPEIV